MYEVPADSEPGGWLNNILAKEQLKSQAEQGLGGLEFYRRVENMQGVAQLGIAVLPQALRAGKSKTTNNKDTHSPLKSSPAGGQQAQNEAA